VDKVVCMKWLVRIWIFSLALGVSVASAARPFADYQVILDRKPFGAPPDRSQMPEKVIRVSESFAAQMLLSGLFEMDDGNLRAAIVDKKDNSYFTLMIGEKNADGIELLDADYEREEATLQKDGQVVVLNMSGATTENVLSSAEREQRLKQAEERRLSYAERRRLRQIERSKPLEVPKPIYTGEELEKHLQRTQMDAIRKGMPPLPVQLTPEQDAELVAEGFLPPVDDEGYEIEEYAPTEDYYYEGYGY
jgi:hypothetical protein